MTVKKSPKSTHLRTRRSTERTHDHHCRHKNRPPKSPKTRQHRTCYRYGPVLLWEPGFVTYEYKYYRNYPTLLTRDPRIHWTHPTTTTIQRPSDLHRQKWKSPPHVYSVSITLPVSLGVHELVRVHDSTTTVRTVQSGVRRTPHVPVSVFNIIHLVPLDIITHTYYTGVLSTIFCHQDENHKHTNDSL